MQSRPRYDYLFINDQFELIGRFADTDYKNDWEGSHIMHCETYASAITMADAYQRSCGELPYGVKVSEDAYNDEQKRIQARKDDLDRKVNSHLYIG